MNTLIANWWTFVVRGIVACLFGVLAFLLPGLALLTLVFMFGFFAIANGILSIAAAFRRKGTPHEVPWWTLLVSGIISILVGLIAVFLPGITALTLAYLIAAWAILTGAMEIATAIQLRKVITGEFWLILAGALSIVFGFAVAAFPGAGALAIVFWIGAYAIVLGVMLIALGFRLHKVIGRSQPRTGPGVAGFAPTH